MKRELSQTEVAYIAGLLDGEGTVAIFRQRTQNRRGGIWIGYSVHVNIANTNTEMLDWVAQRVGGKVYQRAKENYQNRPWKAVWYWHLYGHNATSFLRLVQPYVIAKRQQVALALEFLALGRNHAAPVVRADLWERMRTLNVRGTGNETADGPATVTSNPVRGDLP